MSWVDPVPNVNIRQSFQALITDLNSFHAQFCKEKNRRYFSNIADSCRDFLNLINSENTPSEEIIAGLTNGISTQLSLIVANKIGSDHLQDFTRLSNQVTQQITKFCHAMQAGIRSANHLALSETVINHSNAAAANTSAMRKALTSVQTTEELLEQIDALNDVPVNKSCASIVNRAFAKHAPSTFAGLATATAALGSVIPTAIQSLANVLTGREDECPINSIADPRAIVPVGLSIAAFGMFSYAYLKSRPKSLAKALADNAPEVKIDVAESEQLGQPLLSPNRSSSP